MFTQKELNILRVACGEYKGIFNGHAFSKLTEKEIERHEESIKTAHELAMRFEEILMDYYYREND